MPYERGPVNLPVETSVDQILSQLMPTLLFRKVLFWGEGIGEISSYIAGWMAGQGKDVVVLDGANRFDPYAVSTFAKKASIPPKDLLERIRIARAFTCYQMVTLVEEKLIALLREEGRMGNLPNARVILLGPISTFLDEDVPERETRLLFDRMVKKVEEMVEEGIPFFLFQPNPHSLPFAKKSTGKGGYLMERLFQLSEATWRIGLDEEGPKMILEKESKRNTCGDYRWPHEGRNVVGKGFKAFSIGRGKMRDWNAKFPNPLGGPDGPNGSSFQ